MTLHLVDVSRWQVERPDPLDLAKAKAAGYHIANVALTGGRGYVSGAWARTYADRARALGLGVATYHWLDGRSPGAAQAAATLARLDELGGRAGAAHQVDVEETGEHGIAPPTWAHVRDYVDAVQQGLGRHIAVYSADWRWPAGWPGADLTPYLMAAPVGAGPGRKAHYLPAYPGDDSPAWAAGFGGWPHLSIMQWGVQPLPGTGDCSLSAIRDPAVWAALTGGDGVAVLVPCLVALRAEFNRLNPARDKASDGWIGNPAHAASSSDHNPDESGKTPYEDDDFTDEVHALDVDDSDVPMEKAVQTIVGNHRAGRDDRLQNVIYNRRVWSRSWGWTEKPYTGANAHTEHAHFSARYTTAQENDVSPWGVAALAEDDMNSEQDARLKRIEELVAGLPKAEGEYRIGIVGTDDGKGNRIPRMRDSVRANLDHQLVSINRTVTGLAGAFAAFVAAEKDDDAARAKALDDMRAALATVPTATAGMVLDQLGDTATPEEQAGLLRAVLGDKAAAVGRILAGS